MTSYAVRWNTAVLPMRAPPKAHGASTRYRAVGPVRGAAGADTGDAGVPAGAEDDAAATAVVAEDAVAGSGSGPPAAVSASAWATANTLKS